MNKTKYFLLSLLAVLSLAACSTDGDLITAGGVPAVELSSSGADALLDGQFKADDQRRTCADTGECDGEHAAVLGHGGFLFADRGPHRCRDHVSAIYGRKPQCPCRAAGPARRRGLDAVHTDEVGAGRQSGTCIQQCLPATGYAVPYRHEPGLHPRFRPHRHRQDPLFA